ncbi:transglutaminase family protein [Uliginosibacterium sp. H3]|uniref:Transglutaminase family protein n=1 Tax=Uliginosibacterium silvisoli TaxID=3114758 RepID=A0ABU6JZD4_9RHOO|nr:transglutaminase family protein [Uliginosibacterium sp. H3]
MQLKQRDPRIEAYLDASDIIDFHDSAIQDLAAQLRRDHADSHQLIAASFEWVRDRIAHSWDARQGPLTLRASEVLRSGYGYCYAKSHLLAALLRANGIPTGLCYQRLSSGEQGEPYCLHGLNAVLLPRHGWFRVDARGNKPGVHAVFAPPIEQLAFALQDAHERDFPDVLADPLSVVVDALRTQSDIFALHDNLPDAIGI